LETKITWKIKRWQLSNKIGNKLHFLNWVSKCKHVKVENERKKINHNRILNKDRMWREIEMREKYLVDYQ
jgi:hypothetical protein